MVWLIFYMHTVLCKICHIFYMHAVMCKIVHCIKSNWQRKWGNIFQHMIWRWPEISASTSFRGYLNSSSLILINPRNYRVFRLLCYTLHDAGIQFTLLLFPWHWQWGLIPWGCGHAHLIFECSTPSYSLWSRYGYAKRSGLLELLELLDSDSELGVIRYMSRKLIYIVPKTCQTKRQIANWTWSLNLY